VNTLKLQAFQTQIQEKFGGMHRLHDQPPDPASFSGKASSRKDGDSDGSSGPPSSIDSLDLQSRRSGMGCDSEVREATTRSKGLSTLHGEEDPVVETDSTMDMPWMILAQGQRNQYVLGMSMSARIRIAYSGVAHETSQLEVSSRDLVNDI